MSFPSYNENMKPSKKGRVPSKHDKIVDLAAIAQGSESIAYQAPVQLPQCSVNEHRGVVDLVGAVLDGKGSEGEEGTGGRSDVPLPAAIETAKPLPPIPSPPDQSGDQSSIKMVTDSNKVNPLLKKPNLSPQSDMRTDLPVLGDLRGVGEEEGGQVVSEYHQVPFTPDIDPPLDTNPIEVSSPFVTGNERIDRRTAFTQFCRLGEGRTYIKVADIMALSEAKIREWGKEDGWENAYRSSVTADIAQIAKEENIHEYLDVKREIIAQLKAKIQEAKAGKDVFKSPKEMLDTMLRLEELTGAKGADGNARPGQIFVIIDKEEWEAREKMNEKARKEEAEKV